MRSNRGAQRTIKIKKRRSQYTKVLWSRQQLSDMFFVIQLRQRIKWFLVLPSFTSWRKELSKLSHGNVYKSRRCFAFVENSINERNYNFFPSTIPPHHLQIFRFSSIRVVPRHEHGSHSFFRSLFQCRTNICVRIFQKQHRKLVIVTVATAVTVEGETMANIYGLWSSHLNTVCLSIACFSALTMKHFPKH